MTAGEKNILEVLYHCGVITKGSTKKVNANDNVLLDLVERNIVKKEKISINGKSIALYSLTKFGEEYFIGKSNKNNFFRNDKKDAKLRLSYIYSELSESERQTWKNKTMIMEEHGLSEVPDAIYKKNGKLVAVAFVHKDDKNKKKILLDELGKKMKIAEFKMFLVD